MITFLHGLGRQQPDSLNAFPRPIRSSHSQANRQASLSPLMINPTCASLGSIA